MRIAAVTIASLVLAFAVTASHSACADDGPGRIHRIDVKAQHPKAYHPIVGDLLKCYLDFPIVPEQIVDDLQVTVEGKSVVLVAVVSTSSPKIVGSGQISAFFAPRQAGLARVVVTPVIPGQENPQQITMSFLVAAERSR